MVHEAVIPKSSFAWIEKEVEKLNRRARKINVPELILENVGPAEGKMGKDVFGVSYKIPYIKIRVTGEIPHIDGWNLIARLNRTPSGNVIHPVPGAVPTPDRAKTFYGCDHCGHNRYRTDVFVLEKDGEYKIVGRSCLKDFFEGRSPDALIKYATLVNRLVEKSETAAREEPLTRINKEVYPLDQILVYSVAEIQVYGWVPAGSGFNSTKRAVQNYVLESRYGENRIEELRHLAQEKGIDPFDSVTRIEIDAIIDWALSLDPKNDYEHNLRTIARNGFVTFNQIGFAVSMVPTFRNRRVQKVRPKVSKVSQHIGNVGDRVTVHGSVVFVNSYDTQFGARTLVKVVTGDGNVVNWWAPDLYSYKNADAPIAKRDNVKLTGKIKSLDDYKGQKQTTLNYVKAEFC